MKILFIILMSFSGTAFIVLLFGLFIKGIADLISFFDSLDFQDFFIGFLNIAVSPFALAVMIYMLCLR